MNWTERPHWVVLAHDSGQPTCIGHHPTRALADAQARAKRLTHRGPAQSVTVGPTMGDTEADARATERAYNRAKPVT